MRAGRLVPLLQEFEPPPLPIYAVYPSRRPLGEGAPFVDFLVERFAAGLERGMRRSRVLAALALAARLSQAPDWLLVSEWTRAGGRTA